MATVDKAVVENAAGKSSLSSSVARTAKEIALNPLVYLSSFEFRWVLMVYGSTYMANNAVESICKMNHANDTLPKLVGVTLVNMIASISKDKAFALRFGASSKEPMRPISILVWVVRDVLTISGAFVFPSRVAKVLETQGIDGHLARNLSQLLCPIAFQTFLTPIHLLGLDYYNNPGDLFSLRIARIARLYPFTTFIRMIRMGSAYGIGGVSNSNLRQFFHSKTEGAEWNLHY